MKSSSRILLISSSTVYGRGYLDHVEKQITSFLGDIEKVLFFPFALYDRTRTPPKQKRALPRWVTLWNQHTQRLTPEKQLSKRMRSSSVAGTRSAF